ncbi:MAG: hypothetical protein L6R35_003640 [Caloplaca aegaea]|nr:MAG: hypothetical protein L6R35_003640 [Caloplaca aegaea]
MSSFSQVRWAFLLLTLATATLSVDIRIERTWIIAGEAESFIAAVCLNIQPGECCKAPLRYPDITTKVLFQHLLAWDIAAVWRHNDHFEGSITGCSGLLASQKGPGSWLWRQPPAASTDSNNPAEGASYIRLPRNLPPDPKIFDYLVLQGLLGLVWSSGSWFASLAAEKAFNGRYDIKAGDMVRRDIRSAELGDAYARAPKKIRYPEVVEINGTEYSAEQAGKLVYFSKDNKALDLTGWFMHSGR